MRLTIRRVSAAATVAAVILVVAPRLLSQARELPGGYRWSTAAPFPEPQEELYALTVNGKVYIVGGFGKTGDPQGSCRGPTPQQTGGPKKSMPKPVHHQAQAALQNRIYTFGGCTMQLAGPAAVDNWWEYDPAADSWKALAPSPSRCAQQRPKS